MIKADKLFYTPAYPGKTEAYVLPEEESQHAVKVLRMQAGEIIHLVNGQGGLFEAEIINPHPKRCEVKIINSEYEYGKRTFHLHIAIAPTKMNERMEWFLEKATEIGIDEITPVICRYSERKELKLPRMEKITVAAMKQSVKAYLPKLNEPCSFEHVLKNAIASQKFIAHCHEDEKILLKDAYAKGSDVLILIGPEGDFSKEEIEHALKAGYKPVSLGNSRLRTETAGVVACHTVNLLNE
jgi:16S rRNA (uracil1498-N3)-methyltransferase